MDFLQVFTLIYVSLIMTIASVGAWLVNTYKPSLNKIGIEKPII